MGKRYPRALRERYQAKQAQLVADRLLGKEKFVPKPKWASLKARQIGVTSMTMLGNIMLPTQEIITFLRG